jgi:hypothetical protein
MALAIVKPLVLTGRMHASPITAFTTRLNVDPYLVVNEVPVHDDVIVRGERSEAAG